MCAMLILLKAIIDEPCGQVHVNQPIIQSIRREWVSEWMHVVFMMHTGADTWYLAN